MSTCAGRGQRRDHAVCCHERPLPHVPGWLEPLGARLPPQHRWGEGGGCAKAPAGTQLVMNGRRRDNAGCRQLAPWRVSFRGSAASPGTTQALARGPRVIVPRSASVSGYDVCWGMVRHE